MNISGKFQLVMSSGGFSAPPATNFGNQGQVESYSILQLNSLLEVGQQIFVDQFAPGTAPFADAQHRAAGIKDLAVEGDILRPGVIDVEQGQRGGSDAHLQDRAAGMPCRFLSHEVPLFALSLMCRRSGIHPPKVRFRLTSLEVSTVERMTSAMAKMPAAAAVGSNW
ncbi:hypothetical protein LZK76_28710 (plasmid) [Rhizobium leguminosarum]|nr:hypothetical protein LZK76_28710 [Rhizobium leguminosarum]